MADPDAPRRRLVRVGLFFVLFASGVITSHGAETAGSFRAGAAIVDISPTNFPVIVNAMFTERSATSTVDQLQAKSIVLESGSTRIGITVVDTCMLPRDLIDRAKELASRATGIPAGHLLISATHTHSAPAAMGCLGSRVDPRYAAFLPGRIAESIVRANSNLTPARVGWSVTNDWEHTFNRRWIRRPDRLLNDPFGQPTVRAHMHPGHESPDAIGPSGPVDPGLSLLAIEGLDGQPLAVLANYSQHYYGSPLLSSDYYGRFADHLARLLHPGSSPSKTGAAGALVAIMSQGTSGDLMWMDYAAPRREIGYDAYAREMAERVANLYRTVEFHDSVPLKMAERRLSLGYRVPDPDRLTWARAVTNEVGERLPATLPEIYAFEALHLAARPRTELIVQALRIGDLGIAAMPNEVYALTGLKVKARSPLQPTFTIELANGAEGYIPPPEQHALGGYTTWPARTAGLEVEAEPKIVEAVLELLEDVSGRSRRQEQVHQGPYAASVLASRPVAYWRLEDMEVHTAADSSGQSRTARYEDGIALYLPGAGSGSGISPEPALKASGFSGPGHINRAPHFAGGRMRATLPELGATYSAEFWFWNGLTNNARPVTGYLFSRGLDGDPQARGDHLGIGGTFTPGAAGRLIFFNGNQRGQTLVGRTVLGDRTWHHVVLIREQSRVRVYLNGQADAEIEGQTDATSPAGQGEIFLGGRNDRFAGLEGRLDEVALYDRALTPAEVREHFSASGLAAPAASKPSTATPALSPEASAARWHVRPGYRIELVASEPLVVDPVAIDWDVAGRLWVVEMADYPMGLDGNGKPGGRVRFLEDSDGDGRFDRSTVFAEGLNFPNGILTWRDGVLVTAAPDVLFLKDTDGDGRADVREVLMSGFLEGNQQLRVNGLRWGLDNWVYCAAGGHHRGHGAGTKVRSHRTGTEVAVGSRDLRFRPDTGALEPASGPTQFGRNRDDWGHWFGTQNSWPLWHFVLPDHYLRRNPHLPSPDPVRQVMLPMNPKVFPVRGPEKRYHSFEQAGHFTSACGGMIYRDEILFGLDEAPHGFVCEPVHNLVHHAVLQEDGVSFTALRAPEEEASEFLASEDPWCRPVMVRTGPDGALWVVDMYRYMIEHPDWLPAEGREELLPHYREGDDRGRIYRVVAEASPPRPFQRLDGLSSIDLVAALDSPNGWQRDKVHQSLLWRADSKAVPALERLARNSLRPQTRLHALCVLDGLQSLRADVVIAALNDPNPGIRENALRLAETRGTPEVVDAACRLAGDPSDKVRLQLAFSLGEWHDRRAGTTLAELAGRSMADAALTAAVLSSAIPHLNALVTAANQSGRQGEADLWPAMVRLSLNLSRRDALSQLLKPVLARAGQRFDATQMRCFNEFLDLVARVGTGVDRLMAANPEDPLAKLLSRQGEILSDAAELSRNPTAPSGDRIAAAALLTRDPDRVGAALDSLTQWLRPQSPPETQHLALDAMANSAATDLPDRLWKGWLGFGPALRDRILDVLLNRREWTVRLVEALQSGQVLPGAVDASRRTRLLRHADARVRQAAASVFEAAVATTDRVRVIETLRPALALQGEPARGSMVYTKLCLPCHRRDDQGAEVGPDLKSVVAHPPEKLLISILDPSRDVQPGYDAYECALETGEELYGRIAAETANSVILQMADGSRRTLGRDEITELRGARVSLMPDGLEEGLSPQDMADLIAFLKGGTNEVGLVRSP